MSGETALLCAGGARTYLMTSQALTENDAPVQLEALQAHYALNP